MKRGFSKEHAPLFPRILAIQAEEDEAVYEEWDDRVERAFTTADILDAEQASGGSLRYQEPMRGSIAQTRSERVPTPSYDSPLLGFHTPGSDEERRKKKARTPQPLKRRLFKVRVGSSVDENLNEENPSKHGRSMIEEIDQDAGVTLVQINAEDQGKVTPT
nr:hypothetical protein [Tanacetum cinerariifolium]